MYMPGTKFELKYWENPDHMHRTMLFCQVALTWHSEGDPEKDPEHYTESFDVLDNYNPDNNREGLSRAEVDRHTYDIYMDAQNGL